MNNPISLSHLIRDCNELVRNHPNGELILPQRKRIWKEFGPIQEGNSPSFGTKRRTILEIFNIERYLDLWYNVLPNDDRPTIIIDSIKKYFNNEFDRDKLEGLFDATYCSKSDSMEWETKYPSCDLWGDCDNYLYHDTAHNLNYLVGYCICKIKWLALSDQSFDDMEYLDSDYDCYDTHVSFDISNIAAPFPWENKSPDTVQKRREYWLWYLNEAIPKAFSEYN